MKKNRISSIYKKIRFINEWMNKRIQILKIVKDLPLWFTSEALRTIKRDLKTKRILVDNPKNVSGFIVYEFLRDKCSILWMAVKKDSQRKGIGRELIKSLSKICRNKKIKIIEVDTLAETENYIPYNQTRDFYYSLGFKKYKLIKNSYSEGSDKSILRLKLTNS